MSTRRTRASARNLRSSTNVAKTNSLSGNLVKLEISPSPIKDRVSSADARDNRENLSPNLSPAAKLVLPKKESDAPHLEAISSCDNLVTVFHVLAVRRSCASNVLRHSTGLLLSKRDKYVLAFFHDSQSKRRVVRWLVVPTAKFQDAFSAVIKSNTGKGTEAKWRTINGSVQQYAKSKKATLAGLIVASPTQEDGEDFVAATSWIRPRLVAGVKEAEKSGCLAIHLKYDLEGPIKLEQPAPSQEGWLRPRLAYDASVARFACTDDNEASPSVIRFSSDIGSVLLQRPFEISKTRELNDYTDACRFEVQCDLKGSSFEDMLLDPYQDFRHHEGYFVTPRVSERQKELLRIWKSQKCNKDKVPGEHQFLLEHSKLLPPFRPELASNPYKCYIGYEHHCGWGLFAGEDIPPHKPVCEYAGEWLDYEEYKKRYARHPAHYVMAPSVQQGNVFSKCVDAQFFRARAAFINHANEKSDANLTICTPFRRYAILKTMDKGVKKGESLRYRYGW